MKQNNNNNTLYTVAQSCPIESFLSNTFEVKIYEEKKSVGNKVKIIKQYIFRLKLFIFDQIERVIDAYSDHTRLPSG